MPRLHHLKNSPQLKFQLQGLVLDNLQQLSFQRTGSDNDGPHTFDIKYGTAYPNALSSASGLIAPNWPIF